VRGLPKIAAGFVTASGGGSMDGPLRGTRGTSLPEDIFGAVFWCLSRFIHERRAAGRGVPAEVIRAHQRLAIISDTGTEFSSNPEELDIDDLIGSTEAAALLGCTARHVWNLRTDLDAARRGRNWLYSRRRVIAYAEERNRR
jgi:hypothetical protein